jgi:phage gp46-like protein
MQDIKLKANSQGLYDRVIGENGDFETVDGFETAILVSLFTDARAPKSLVPNAERRRGWAGSLSLDSFEGSILWVYEQSRLTQDTMNAIESAAYEALYWMVRDKIAKNIQVSVEKKSRGVEIFITITANNNTVHRYGVLWQKTGSF